jgi:phosphoserine aminotransferase
MKKLFLTLTIATLAVFSSCKENATEKINQEKADLLYGEIDRNPLFEGTAAKEDRSNMNVCFLLTDSSKEEAFNNMWNEAGISGIKGHRSVGGYRASMYNAMPFESVSILVDIMKELENKKG